MICTGPSTTPTSALIAWPSLEKPQQILIWPENEGEA